CPALQLQGRLQQGRWQLRREGGPQGHRDAAKARRETLWRRRRPSSQPEPRHQGAQGVRKVLRGRGAAHQSRDG
ncbi:hypothetical protein BN1708_020299, partial [Verticillium longisporum]